MDHWSVSIYRKSWEELTIEDLIMCEEQWEHVAEDNAIKLRKFLIRSLIFLSFFFFLMSARQVKDIKQMIKIGVKIWQRNFWEPKLGGLWVTTTQNQFHMKNVRLSKSDLEIAFESVCLPIISLFNPPHSKLGVA